MPASVLKGRIYYCFYNPYKNSWAWELLLLLLFLTSLLEYNCFTMVC